MTEEIVEATPSPPDSFIYQPVAVEAEQDLERTEEILQRRNDLLARINEESKMHTAMILYNEECSNKTRELVRQRRRVRENIEKQKEGLRRAQESRRKASGFEAEATYEDKLKAEFDDPKSKVRRRKNPPAQVTNFIPAPSHTPKEGGSPLEGDGRATQEVDGAAEG